MKYYILTIALLWLCGCKSREYLDTKTNALITTHTSLSAPRYLFIKDGCTSFWDGTDTMYLVKSGNSIGLLFDTTGTSKW